jgi:hypothetical protein
MFIVTSMLAMLIFVPVVAFIALMMWLLHRMNRPGKVWVGWVMLAAIFILITAASLLNAKYGVTTGNGWQSYQLWLEDKKIQYAGIDVAYNEETNQVYGFGSLVLQYENGNRYIPLEFDEDGNLIGSKEALSYKKEIQEVMKNGGPKVSLIGKSKNYATMKKLEHDRMNQHKNTFHKDFFWYNMLTFQIVTVILLVFYVVDLIRRKRKEKRNTNMIKIQDL